MNRGPPEGAMADAPAGIYRPPPNVDDPELRECLRQVGENASKKFGTVHRAWRSVDLEKDGSLSKKQIRQFFDTMGYDERMADKFFDHVNGSGPEADETIDYKEFSNYFAPLVYGWSQLGPEDGRLGKFKEHYQNKAATCKFTEERDNFIDRRKGFFESGSSITSETTTAASSRPSTKSSRRSARSETPRRKASSIASYERRTQQSQGTSAVDDDHLTSNEAETLLKEIGKIMAAHSSSVRQAYRKINPEGAGMIDKTKFRDFVKLYGYSKGVA